MTDPAILRQNADRFAKDCAAFAYEMGEAQKFITALCRVYGLDAHHAVEFEFRVRKADRKGINRIDGFFPGLLLIEMKSRGEDLEAAFNQALEYVQLLEKESDKPEHILVSDFENLHLYALTPAKTAALPEKTLKFKLYDFQRHVEDLAFIAGYERIIAKRNEALTLAAADSLSALHREFLNQGYGGASLQTMLVRLLFCLFADDTELFGGNGVFEALVSGSQADGGDLGGRLRDLFEWLDTADRLRQNTLKPLLAEYGGFRLQFPYINGKLFAQNGGGGKFAFNGQMRRALLKCCEIDWADISPDIFGTLFQNIMESADTPPANGKKRKSARRRAFGEHYTSEKNIRRAINPLFLDGLKEQYRQAQGDAKKLEKFVKHIQQMHVLDPACGCGNFLIVAYREMRLLEMQALRELEHTAGAQQAASQCDVHQFHGIEIDPAACEIAAVAMWLTDHQMNRRYREGYKRIPLERRADIHCANALQADWETLVSRPQEIAYIVGNPPFLGKKEQSPAQKADMGKVVGHIKGAGVLDYVTAWYIKAVQWMKRHPHVKAAFVSTNSITQGEQVAVLWPPLLAGGIHILFAHRTFKWQNAGHGMAAVHCVIIGFAIPQTKTEAARRRTLWDYSDDIAGDGREQSVRRINPYLLEAPDIIIGKRGKPVSPDAPPMSYGSMPIDDGFLILSESEFQAALQEDPANGKLIRPYMGGKEFLNGIKRYCLWLDGIPAEQAAASSFARRRTEQVRAFREKSKRKTTYELAAAPGLFGEIRQPENRYLLLPKVSSENRRYLPIGYIEPDIIANGSALIVPDATLYHFGILCSTMHNAFMRAVAGRLESRYQYSSSVVYNNFPFPALPPETTEGGRAHRAAIEAAAQAVLDGREAERDRIRRINAARAAEPGFTPLPEPTLAGLYHPDTMPPPLAEAHNALDDAVDEAYGYTGKTADADRVSFLLARYQELTGKA